MKRILAMLLALTMVLALSGCGRAATSNANIGDILAAATPTLPDLDEEVEGTAAAPDTTPAPAQSEPETPQPEQSAPSAEQPADQTTVIGTAVETYTEVSEPENAGTEVVDAHVDTETSDNSASKTAPEGQAALPTVTFITVQEDQTDEDGTLLVEFAYDSATVTIPGNDKAAQAIQQDLASIQEDARQDAAEMAADKLDSDFTGNYYLKQSFTVTRADAAIISILITYTSYQGGAHGSTVYSGVTYDAATGSRLTLASLGSGVTQKAADTVLALAEQVELVNPGFFFTGFRDGVSRYVVQDSYFYLSENGLVFADNEYTLQSYAAGPVFFTVSYGDLNGILDARFMGSTTAASQAETADGGIYTLR